MTKNLIPHFCADSIDDLMRANYDALIKHGSKIKPGKGNAIEIIGLSVELTQPRSRLSQSATRGKIFSALGELFWYLSGSRKANFIKYYIKGYEQYADKPKAKDPIIHGGYGPRIFSRPTLSRFDFIRDMLLKKQDSRQAVIQIFSNNDIIKKHEDVPCTCTLQFFLRNSKLHLVVHMRSNDAFAGFTHDVFSFTMMQEIMARSLGVELGSYKHLVGSMHFYETDRKKIEKFLSEGWHSTQNSMPPMPIGDPWTAIQTLLRVELELRTEGIIKSDITQLDPYWLDLAKILQMWSLIRRKNRKGRKKLVEELSNSFYTPFLLSKT